MLDELYRVLRLIRPLHRNAARAVTAALAERDISMPVRALMEQLYEDGGQTVPKLARALWMTRQGVQRLADEARSLGYVETSDNPAHRRSSLLWLTESGEAAYASLHRVELENLRPLAADLNADEVEACIKVLTRLADRMCEIAEGGESR